MHFTQPRFLYKVNLCRGLNKHSFQIFIVVGFLRWSYDQLNMHYQLSNIYNICVFKVSPCGLVSLNTCYGIWVIYGVQGGTNFTQFHPNFRRKYSYLENDTFICKLLLIFLKVLERIRVEFLSTLCCCIYLESNLHYFLGNNTSLFFIVIFILRSGLLKSSAWFII